MGKFNAGTAVESMEWDFTDFGGGTGVIPEPTTEVINEFNRRVSILTESAARHTGKDLENLSEGDLEALSREDDSFLDETCRILAFVCQDSPDFDNLKKLPPRVLMAFQGWLVGELNPERAAAALKR